MVEECQDALSEILEKFRVGWHPSHQAGCSCHSLLLSSGELKSSEGQNPGDQNTAIRKQVPMPGVEGPADPDLDRALKSPLGEDRRSMEDPPLRVDQAGNPGIGGAGKGDPVLHRSEHDHPEMLIGRN